MTPKLIAGLAACLVLLCSQRAVSQTFDRNYRAFGSLPTNSISLSTWPQGRKAVSNGSHIFALETIDPVTKSTINGGWLTKMDMAGNVVKSALVTLPGIQPVFTEICLNATGTRIYLVGQYQTSGGQTAAVVVGMTTNGTGLTARAFVDNVNGHLQFNKIAPYEVQGGPNRLVMVGQMINRTATSGKQIYIAELTETLQLKENYMLNHPIPGDSNWIGDDVYTRDLFVEGNTLTVLAERDQTKAMLFNWDLVGNTFADVYSGLNNMLSLDPIGLFETPPYFEYDPLTGDIFLGAYALAATPLDANELGYLARMDNGFGVSWEHYYEVKAGGMPYTEQVARLAITPSSVLVGAGYKVGQQNSVGLGLLSVDKGTGLINHVVEPHSLTLGYGMCQGPYTFGQRYYAFGQDDVSGSPYARVMDLSANGVPVQACPLGFVPVESEPGLSLVDYYTYTQTPNVLNTFQVAPDLVQLSGELTDCAYQPIASFKQAVSTGQDALAEDEASGLTLFPNPAHEQLTLEFADQGTYVVELVDLTGKTLQVVEINGQGQLDLSKVPSGVYLLKATSDGESIVKRVVKQ